MSVKPGRESSEFWKALRAEASGFVLLVVGSIHSLRATDNTRAAVGLGLVTVGGYVLAKASDSYAASRGAVKAAAVRRPADIAPRGL